MFSLEKIYMNKCVYNQDIILFLGVKGEQLMSVATEDEDTCKDMADIS